jgi:hypothetical protein
MVIIDELKESNNPGGKNHTKWQFKLPFILFILWSFKLTENGQPLLNGNFSVTPITTVQYTGVH